MNKYIAFSFIAVAPFMLQGEDVLNEEIGISEPLLSVEPEPLAPIENIVQEELSYKQADSPSGVSASSKSWECRPDIQPYQVSIGHIEGKGVGYDTGYTTLEAFFAPTYGKYVPFFDARGHVFDNGKLAANLGLGLRYVWKPEKYLFGVNGYYDYRDTKRGHYNQIGAGLEVFADRYEFRANGYFPVGNKHFQYDKELTGISFKRFEGNNILINEFYDAKVEYAMKGFNAEIGAHLIAPRPDYDLFVGAGTYYFIGEFGKNTWGGKIRLSGKVTKYVSLEISDSFDRVFHNRFQGQVIVSYPFGSKKLRPQKRPNPSTCYNENLMYARAAQPVQRQDIIVVNNKKEPFVIDPIAIDPTTGQPFFVVFVDNTNTVVGNGTFENPFQNLSTGDNATNAQDSSAAGNTIYVFSGDGTTTHMSNGIVLKANQRFLGSSTTHAYQTTLGTLVIPAQTATVPSVGFVGASGGFGVQLNNSTEVTGFAISPNMPTTTGASCVGANAITGGGIIRDNILIGETLGIKIGNPTGPTLFGQGDFIISNNISTGHNTDMSTEGFGIRADFGNGYVLISNNDFSDNLISARGMFISARSSANPLTVDILNNQCNNNDGRGVTLVFSNENVGTSPVCVNFDGNTANANANAGIIVNSAIGVASGFSVPHLILNNNTALNNVPNTIMMMQIGGGIVVETTGTNSDLCARVTNNLSTITLPSAPGGPADFQFSSAGTPPSNFYLEPLIGNTGTWFSEGTLIMTEAGDCNCP